MALIQRIWSNCKAWGVIAVITLINTAHKVLKKDLIFVNDPCLETSGGGAKQ